MMIHKMQIHLVNLTKYNKKMTLKTNEIEKIPKLTKDEDTHGDKEHVVYILFEGSQILL